MHVLHIFILKVFLFLDTSICYSTVFWWNFCSWKIWCKSVLFQVIFSDDFSIFFYFFLKTVSLVLAVLNTSIHWDFSKSKLKSPLHKFIFWTIILTFLFVSWFEMRFFFFGIPQGEGDLEYLCYLHSSSDYSFALIIKYSNK